MRDANQHEGKTPAVKLLKGKRLCRAAGKGCKTISMDSRRNQWINFKNSKGIRVLGGRPVDTLKLVEMTTI
jgi:hypothetical protein